MAISLVFNKLANQMTVVRECYLAFPNATIVLPIALVYITISVVVNALSVSLELSEVSFVEFSVDILLHYHFKFLTSILIFPSVSFPFVKFASMNSPL